jgi:hypothetical protein
MENKVELKFDKTVTRLAGNPYGRLVYEEQVKGKVDFGKTVYITFPDEIIYIASSFVQGFFDEIVKIVGILGVGRNVIVTANGVNVQKMIIDNLIM